MARESTHNRERKIFSYQQLHDVDEFNYRQLNEFKNSKTIFTMLNDVLTSINLQCTSTGLPTQMHASAPPAIYNYILPQTQTPPTATYLFVYTFCFSSFKFKLWIHFTDIS